MTGAMKNRFQIIKAACLLLAIMVFSGTGASVSCAGEKFLSAIDDLPLMSQLDEIEGTVMVFDSPSGRVVEALTMGKVLEKDVLHFYAQTLPQLGWIESKPGKYSREGGTLRLEFPQTRALSGEASSAGPMLITVLFLLSPTK